MMRKLGWLTLVAALMVTAVSYAGEGSSSADAKAAHSCSCCCEKACSK